MLVSVADRIKRFRELSAQPAPKPDISLSLTDSLATLRRMHSCEGSTSYSSVEDIVSLLREKATSRVAAPVESKPDSLQIDQLVNKLTQSIPEEPEEIIARIRKRLEVPVEDAKMADTPPVSLPLTRRDMRTISKIGFTNLREGGRKNFSVRASEHLVVRQQERRELSLVKAERTELSSSAIVEPSRGRVEDMCFNPDWRRYIEREIASVRSQIKCSLMR